MHVSRNFFSCFSCYACNLICYFLGSWIYAIIYLGCPMWPSSSLFWDLWLSWQSLLDFRTSEPHSSGCGRPGNIAWEAEPCQRWACSSSGQTRLATSVVGSSCAVVQGHLWNRLGQSNRITVLSEHTEGLQAFDWMLRKKRMLWYLYSRRIQRGPMRPALMLQMILHRSKTWSIVMS